MALYKKKQTVDLFKRNGWNGVVLFAERGSN